MKLSLGIDVGTVSAKYALVGNGDLLERCGSNDGVLERIFDNPNGGNQRIGVSPYQRIQGRPLWTVYGMLDRLFRVIEPESLRGIVVTGSAGRLIADRLGIAFENEFKSVANGVGALYPEVENIFEMGGENSKFVRITMDNGVAGILDYETNGDCAAGTGSFMDQQATRLKFDIEEVGSIVLRTDKTPKIAGRCSVFAKSDMIHAQQKGYSPEEVLKGLCEAVARNFRSNVARGREVEGKTAFVGGVALNQGVAEALRKVFKLEEKDFLIPPQGVHVGAIGAALVAHRGGGRNFDPQELKSRLSDKRGRRSADFASLEPLTIDKVDFLRDRVRKYSFQGVTTPVDAFLGVDVGSVSTNLVVIDGKGNVIKDVYLRTEARPIQVVARGLREIEEEVGDKIRIRGVGTTGSGRELIGELIGADTVNDEITAHKTGSSFIGRRLIDRKVDTIFEIGGQDSKFISIRDDIVVDFTMNEACAAGTGSFLEEQAEKLDLNIIDEFAELAFSSRAPIRLGERCTVYMEQDVSAYMKRGAEKRDIIAGLAYSVVQNYLNRVVRGRKIGEVIFFQGGTAYNDAVAAAFSRVLGKEIIVPPHNGVIGAVGAALLATEKVAALGLDSGFRGYDLEAIDYGIREFTCKGCSNYCNIQEFTVEGEKTYWGDKCSDRYRKRAKVDRKPVIPDLMGLYDQMLERDAIPLVEESLNCSIDRSPPSGSKRPRVGFLRALYFYDRFQFWKTYLESMGMEIVLTPETNKRTVNRGLEAIVAEPCFPIQVAHGHLASLLREDVDSILVPNVINAETDIPEVESYMCPWGQTLPFVLRRIPAMEGREDLIAAPTVRFRKGENFAEKQLWDFGRRFGVNRRRHKKAVRYAYEAHRLFNRDLLRAGRDALMKLDENDQIGIILVGRPYNIMDREVNMNVPGKLRDYYGVNVIPFFFLPIEGIGIRDIDDNMFWNFGRKVLQSARFAAQSSNLHLIYITNFKCGPDSYVKHYADQAAVRPYLTLQFDGHGNDAGIMTRCEAYLDSKGVLRWWKDETSQSEHSTYRECPTEEQKPSQRHSGTLG